MIPPPGSEPGDAKSPRAVLFRDVDELAALERILNKQIAPEPPDIAEMRQQAVAAAEDIVRLAMEDAAQMLHEAKEAGYRAGYEKGYADGDTEARSQVFQRADAERAAFRADIEAFVTHIEAERMRAWNAMEPEIIGLIFQLAQQVIKQEVEVNRDVALSITRNALRRVADSSSLRIRVHADDLETIRSHREDLLTLVDGMPHFEIIADRRVGPGGCIVETPAGNIDARIETQLDTVADTLEQMVTHLERAA